MPWFKVDDSFTFHPKVIALSPHAGWLWTRAGAWCAQQLTDGHVPARIMGALNASTDHANELVEAGLWDAEDDGWRFHDWSDYQPSKEAVEAERAAARERQRKAREAAKAKRHAVSHAVTSPELTPDVTAKSRRESRSPHPIPSRPTKNTSPAEPDTFERWWAAWPRKEARPKAAVAYGKALAIIDADRLLALTVQWFEDRPTLEPQFIPLPATWLNQQRWTDERQVNTAPASVPSFWDRKVVSDR